MHGSESQLSTREVQVKFLGDLPSIENMNNCGGPTAKLGDNAIEVVMLPMFGEG